MLHDPRRQQQQQHHHQQVRSPSSLEDSHRPGGGVQALPNGQGPWQGRPPSRHHHPHQHHPHQQRVPSRRPSSPSDSTSTSSDDREEMARSLVRRPAPPGGKSWQHQHQDGFRAGGGTLRSTRSVPALALATWDGEPCPVHGHGPSFFPPHGPPPPHGPLPLGPPHGPPPQLPQSMPAQASMRRFGSMFDVRAGYYPMAPLDRKSLHGSMSALGVPPAAPPPPMGPPYMPPPHLMPPMMRPRPYVFPAEPLPTRDPFRPKTPVLQPPKLEQDYYSVDQVCCKGHLVVLWIILAVVTIGVILGIILGVTVT